MAKIGEIYDTTTLADVMTNAPDKVEQFKATREGSYGNVNVGWGALTYYFSLD